MATKTVRKRTSKKVASPPKRKAGAKKTTAVKSASKTAPRKTAAKKTAAVRGQSLPRNYSDEGFVIGSDTDKIAKILLEGGASLKDISAKVGKAITHKTRNGNTPNPGSLTANVLKKMVDKGYVVESTWSLQPPTAASKAKATRTAKRAAKKTSA